MVLVDHGVLSVDPRLLRAGRQTSTEDYALGLGDPIEVEIQQPTTPAEFLMALIEAVREARRAIGRMPMPEPAKAGSLCRPGHIPFFA